MVLGEVIAAVDAFQLVARHVVCAPVVRHQALARAARIVDRRAAVGELRGPDEHVAFLADEDLALEPALRNLRVDVGMDLVHLAVERADAAAGKTIRRNLVTAGEIEQRPGVGMHVFQAHRGDDHLVFARRRHEPRVDVVGLLAALDEIERIAGDRRPVEQLIQDRHQAWIEIAIADLAAFQGQVVELDRAPERLVRRVGKPHALRLRGAGEQIDDHTARKRGGPCARTAQPLDQRVDGIDDIGAEELRQDEIAVALPLLPLFGRERACAFAGRATALQGDGILHRAYSRQLNGRNLRERAGSGNLSRWSVISQLGFRLATASRAIAKGMAYPAKIRTTLQVLER